MGAIFRRELKSYFTGSIGLVYTAAFILIMNILYCINVLSQYTSDFTFVFREITIVMIFLVPLMTMRIWSEEKKQKTDQLLLTAPVTTMEIVFGKFFAALTLFVIALSLTLVYPIISSMYGTLSVAITVGNYVAIILAASAYIAISQFMSSLTESQIISAILSIVTLSAFWLLDLLFQSTNIDFISQVTSFISIITRFTNFYKGIFSLSDTLYFISIAAIFLFLTSRVVEKRRWS